MSWCASRLAGKKTAGLQYHLNKLTMNVVVSTSGQKRKKFYW